MVSKSKILSKKDEIKGMNSPIILANYNNKFLINLKINTEWNIKTSYSLQNDSIKSVKINMNVLVEQQKSIPVNGQLYTFPLLFYQSIAWFLSLLPNNTID